MSRALEPQVCSGLTLGGAPRRQKAFMHGLVLPVVSGEENKATLLELGAVEPLTKLLTHEDKIVRRNAMMIFGILASNSE